MWTIGSLGVQNSAIVGALIVDFIIQWVGWGVSASLQTDKLYDALGSTTFAALAIGTLTYAKYYYARQILTTVLVVVWAARLGGFLVFRVIKTGKDSRFDEAKKQPLKFWVFWTLQAVWVWVTLLPVMILNGSANNPMKFWVFWTLQAVWVWVTLLPVMILNGSANNPSLWASDVIGVILWVVGFALECAADSLKYAFKQNPANKGRFVNVGPWKYARYPNYGGEILQWWGLWLLSIAVLRGAYWVCIISPLFLMCLLLFVSGVPLQEKQAKERWGDEEGYQAYRRSTFLLLPIPKFWHKEKKPLTES